MTNQQPTQAEVVAVLLEACRETRETLHVAVRCGLRGFSEKERDEIVEGYYSTIRMLTRAIDLAQSVPVPEVVEENPLLETVLDDLRGPRESFRELLTNKDNLLARIIRCAERKARATRREIWAVIGEITGHGSGVSAAIYELYRDRPSTFSEREPNPTEKRE